MSNYIAIVLIMTVAVFSFITLVGGNSDSIKSKTHESMNNTISTEQQTP